MTIIFRGYRLLVVALIVIILKCMQFIPSWFTVHDVLCQMPTSLVPIMQRELESSLRTQCNGVSMSSMPEMCHQFMEQYPFVRSMHYALQPNRVLNVTITCRDPHYLINKDHLLLDDGVLTAASIFQENLTEKLRTIAVHTEQLTSKHAKELFDFCNALSGDNFAEYQFSWISAHEIYACHATHIIRATAQQFPTILHEQKEKLQMALSCAQPLKNPRDRYMIDVRFASQLVLSVYTGGEINGTQLL